MDIKNKVAIVTGGASGFGLRLTERLCQQKCSVIVLDINQKSLEKIKTVLPLCKTIKCDVSDISSVDSAISQIVDEFEIIDILINNAGIMKSAPLVNFLAKGDRKHSLETWNNVLSTNLNSVFYLTRNVADKMLKDRIKGVIVNISSISSSGNSGQSAYSASKAAVEALTKVWAKELGPFGIRCVGVAPGFCDTQGTANAIEKELLDRWVSKVPLRRLGAIDEVVDSVLFAINNDFYNGQILNINGGLVI
jgi:3-oxoacyl-[acyl-carrier protein] reductase